MPTIYILEALERSPNLESVSLTVIDGVDVALIGACPPIKKIRLEVTPEEKPSSFVLRLLENALCLKI